MTIAVMHGDSSTVGNAQWKALLVGTGTDHRPEDGDEPILREAVARSNRAGSRAEE